MRVTCTKGKDGIKFRLKNFDLDLDGNLNFFSSCDKCKNVGHATECCPIRKCFKCKGFGHSHFDCPTRRKRRHADEEREKFKNFRKAYAWYPRRKRSVATRWRRHVYVRTPRVRNGGAEGQRFGIKCRSDSPPQAPQKSSDGAPKTDDDVRLSKLQK
jgi:hypothetical protein